MTLKYREFFTQLIGARLCDEQRWTGLKQEDCLWSMFAFGDDGVHYLRVKHRQEPDWGDVKRLPGYYEPSTWNFQ